MVSNIELQTVLCSIDSFQSPTLSLATSLERSKRNTFFFLPTWGYVRVNSGYQNQGLPRINSSYLTGRGMWYASSSELYINAHQIMEMNICLWMAKHVRWATNDVPFTKYNIAMHVATPWWNNAKQLLAALQIILFDSHRTLISFLRWREITMG